MTTVNLSPADATRADLYEAERLTLLAFLKTIGAATPLAEEAVEKFLKVWQQNNRRPGVPEALNNSSEDAR